MLIFPLLIAYNMAECNSLRPPPRISSGRPKKTVRELENNPWTPETVPAGPSSKGGGALGVERLPPRAAAAAPLPPLVGNDCRAADDPDDDEVSVPRRCDAAPQSTHERGSMHIPIVGRRTRSEDGRTSFYLRELSFKMGH